MVYKKHLEKIKRDNKRGASELKKLAQETVSYALQECKSSKEFLNFLNNLKESKPLMAPIQNLAEEIIKSIRNIKSMKEIRDKISKAELLDVSNGINLIRKNAESILKSCKKVLTYSYSRTVFEILKDFKNITVIVPESRPVYEGRRLAKNLHNAGIKVIFITDAEISKFIKGVDVVLLGADRVTEDSFVNKVGSLGIALLSREFKVPLYIVCSEDKFLSKKKSIVKDRKQDAMEIWRNPPDGIEIRNYYFEEVPLRFVTGVITEKGVKSRERDLYK